MAISQTFNLSFISNANEIIRFSVPRADEGIDPTDALASMQAIIDNGSVLTKQGIPQQAKNAILVSRESRKVTP